MKKSLLLVLICMLIELTNVSAQDITEHKNVVNLGLGGLALGNVSLNYERTFSDSRAASLTAGFLVPRNLPSFIYDNLSDEDNWDADNKLSGFFIMPEYRFYPSYKIAPEGFYIAPFLRLNHYTLDIGGDFNDITADIKGKISGIGGGVQFGMHWVIKERISIDFYLAGPGFFYNSISLRFESDDPDVDYDELRGNVEVDITGIPIIGERTEIEVGDDYVDAKSSFMFPGFRSGLSIGIVF
jgi:hypothetical protein